MEYNISKVSNTLIGSVTHNSLPLSPSQDKSVAFKIFELGSKRFGDNPDYTIEYLDHLSHLNGTLTTISAPQACLQACLQVYSVHNFIFFRSVFCLLLEDNNTRVLFEKAVSTMPPEKTRRVLGATYFAAVI